MAMQDALQGYENAAVMGTGSQERYAGDNRLFVEFYRKAVFNKSKSDEAGRPVYDEEDFVRITVPGDKYTNSDQKVNEAHKHRFPRQWQAYQAGMEQAQSGTPLEVWPQMTVGMVATLKAMKITTVEQLAELSDANAMQLMGNHDLRRRAKAFLEAAAGEAANTHLAAELEKRDKEIALMREQMNKLIAANNSKPAQEKPAKVDKSTI
jgi:hypothetical protein